MTKFSTLKKKMLADPVVRAEYEALAPEFDLARMLIEARIAANMTQREVAKKMGTKPEQISRMESGRHKPSYKSIERYAEAVGRQLRVSLV